MGVTYHIFEEYCKSYFESANEILELGAQNLFLNGRMDDYFKNLFPQYKVTSYDMNGENHSRRVNLADEQTPEKTFDLVSNFGTSEHVPNQYICWKNIHSFCSPGGIVINEIPRIGHWPNHCKYYVDRPFFESMAKDFEIVFFTYTKYNEGDLCFCILKKISDSFLTTREEFEKNIYEVPGFKDPMSFYGTKNS